MKLKKIGIMGGTFNPPHIGHLAAAEAAAEALKLEKVIFMPTGKIPHKNSSGIISPDDRFKMTLLAIDKNPIFDITDIETRSNEFSYTCNSIEKLNEGMPEAELFFIVGADSLDYMDRWREPERIFRSCSVIAVSRDGFSTEMREKKAEELRETFNAKIFLVTMPNIGVSSSEIRRRVREGITINYMLPDSVKKYIEINGLYLGRKDD